VRKAELAVDKKQDDLARAALERSMTARNVASSFAEQVADQTAQVENLKTALRKLEMKLGEAQSKSDVLMAQHRRARALSRASDARMKMSDGSKAATFDRVKNKVHQQEAISQAKSELAVDNVEDRLAALEKEDAVDKLLAEIKARKGVA
jgi:phage shock protein A